MSWFVDNLVLPIKDLVDTEIVIAIGAPTLFLVIYWILNGGR